MLVLSRKKNEQIAIGEDVVLTVVEIRGDKCRIGIDADPKVPVHRMEIKRKIEAEQGQSSGRSTGETGDEGSGTHESH